MDIQQLLEIRALPRSAVTTPLAMRPGIVPARPDRIRSYLVRELAESASRPATERFSSPALKWLADRHRVN